MPFALDDTSISLMTIGETIAQSDLVPSRLPLRDHVLPLMRQFNAWGLEHLGDLRKALKTPKKALVLAQTLQIDPQLLVLLRREIEAFFPKPIPLREWVWFHEKDLAFLSDKGISNHIDLYNSLTEPGLRRELEGELEPSASWTLILQTLELTRVRWVSPLFAEMLLQAGYQNPKAIAEGNKDKMFEQLVKVNQGGAYYRGTIGMRDILRVIDAARFLVRQDG
jgi:hypothetical protein